MLLLVSVAYLTLLAVAFQDEIDRWFIDQWRARRFETFSCDSGGRIDAGMNADNNERSMTLLLVDDDDPSRERLARALRAGARPGLSVSTVRRYLQARRGSQERG